MPYFIVKHNNRLMPLRLEGKNKAVIIPGIGLMDKQELKDVAQKAAETQGVDISEASIDKQIEQRTKGTYKDTPSLKRKVAGDGFFTNQEKLDWQGKNEPSIRQA